jgi:hypothetical protein
VRGADSVAAQSGLGYDAAGLADAVADHFTIAVHTALNGTAHSGDAS